MRQFNGCSKCYSIIIIITNLPTYSQLSVHARARITRCSVCSVLADVCAGKMWRRKRKKRKSDGKIIINNINWSMRCHMAHDVITTTLRCCIVSNFLFICVNFNDRPFWVLTATAATPTFSRWDSTFPWHSAGTQSPINVILATFSKTTIFSVYSIFTRFSQHTRSPVWHKLVIALENLIVSRKLPSCSFHSSSEILHDFSLSLSLTLRSTFRRIGVTCTSNDCRLLSRRLFIIKIEYFDISLMWSVFTMLAACCHSNTHSLSHLGAILDASALHLHDSIRLPLATVSTSMEMYGDYKLVRSRPPIEWEYQETADRLPYIHFYVDEFYCHVLIALDSHLVWRFTPVDDGANMIERCFALANRANSISMASACTVRAITRYWPNYMHWPLSDCC